ncbi:MAG: DoxX family protein [Bellilinea sp.]|jgi:putative oxidoreductase
MLENIFSPYSDLGLFILRLAASIIFLVHGWPKLNPNSPMKGPAGFGGFLKQMGVPLPILFGWLVALLETGGALLLILGLGTRILAVLFAIDMLVAILSVKIRVMKVGFSAQQATGWEFDFILGAVALSLLFTGAGNIALDPVLGL